MNGELEQHLTSCEDELKRINSWIEKNTLDNKVRYLITYAVIKASGTIEYVLKNILFSAIVEGCSEEAKLFLEKKIVSSGYNPSFDNICNLLKDMNEDWKRLFKGYRKDNRQYFEQLDSLVLLRNSISHGFESYSVTISDLIKYFDSGRKILEMLQSIVDQSDEN